MECTRTRIILLLSGGIDSSTLACVLKAEAFDVLPLFVDYGQLASAQEWKSVVRVAGYLGLTKPVRISVSQIAALSKNQLTTRRENDPFFPFRNAVLLTVAATYGESLSCSAIAIGIVRGNRHAFPDCSQRFVNSIGNTLSASVDHRIHVLAPLLTYSKDSVVLAGLSLGFPYELTYSCYLGGARHCGRCAACEGRRNVFGQANVTDPTRYEQYEGLP